MCQKQGGGADAGRDYLSFEPPHSDDQRIGKVTIAAIHGYAYGGGFNIMLPCDFRFAEAKTKFIENFYYMGVTPDLGSSYFFPD